MQQKIEELRKERWKINVDELKSQKEEYTGKLTEIFNKTSELHPEEEWKKIIKLISKINDKLKLAMNLDKKINNLEESRKEIQELPLYKDTQAWIADILWNDPVYKLAEENWDKETMEKFRTRKLRLDEYTELQSKLIKEPIKDGEEIDDKVEETTKENEEEVKENEDIDEWWDNEISTESEYEPKPVINHTAVEEIDTKKQVKSYNNEDDFDDRYTEEQLKKIDNCTKVEDLNILIKEYTEFWFENIEIASSLFDKMISFINDYKEDYYENNSLNNYELVETYSLENRHEINEVEVKHADPEKLLLEKYYEYFESIINLISNSDLDNDEIVNLLISYSKKEVKLDIENEIISDFDDSCKEIIENWLTTVISKDNFDKNLMWKIYESKYKKSIINWAHSIIKSNQKLDDRDAFILLDLWCWRTVIDNIDHFNLSKYWFEELKEDVRKQLYKWRNNDYKSEEFKNVKTPQWLRLLVNKIIKWKTNKRNAIKEWIANQEAMKIITPKFLYNLYNAIIEWNDTGWENLSDEKFWDSIKSLLEEELHKDISEIKEEIKTITDEDTKNLLEIILNIKEKLSKSHNEKSVSYLLPSFNKFKKITVPFEIDNEVLKNILAYWEDYIKNPRNPKNKDENIKIYNWETLALPKEIMLILKEIKELETEKSKIEKEILNIENKSYKEYPKSDEEKLYEEKMWYYEKWHERYINLESDLNNLNIRKQRREYVERTLENLNGKIEVIQSKLMPLEEKYVKYLKDNYPQRVYNAIIEYKKQNNK